MLMFGQNFVGANVVSANGTYAEQVYRFRIVDDGVSLSVVPLGPLPALPIRIIEGAILISCRSFVTGTT
jgi:hypothetical protein